MTHDVEFPDGEIKEYSVIVIAEDMHAQVDDDGHNVKILDAIVDCRKYVNVVDKADMNLRVKSR